MSIGTKFGQKRFSSLGVMAFDGQRDGQTDGPTDEQTDSMGSYFDLNVFPVFNWQHKKSRCTIRFNTNSRFQLLML